MSRPTAALTTTLDGLMNNSALAMDEQRTGALLVALAKRARRTIRRAAAADGVIDAHERKALNVAGLLVRGCERALEMDVQDEAQLREGNRALDEYAREVVTRGHKRHEAPLQGPRTHTQRA